MAQRFALTFVASLTASMVLSGCRTDVQSGLQTANDLLYKQKYVDAERLYRKLLKGLESNKELSESEEAQRLQVLNHLGEINAFYLHDYPQAIADFENLARKYPKDDHALTAVATMADLYHYKLNNLPQAIAAYQRVVTAFPTRPEARDAQLEIVGAYFKMKNYDQARTEATALIGRWPGTAEAAQARFETADSYYLQKRYNDAIAAYQQMLTNKSDKGEEALVIYELGNCYQELGEAERALNYYYEALPAHPNPALVQRKIERVRQRLYHITPMSGIQNGPRTPAERHLAAMQPRRRKADAAGATTPTGAAGAQTQGTAEDAANTNEDAVVAPKGAVAPGETGSNDDTGGE